MIIGIGCDVLHIDRVEKLVRYKNFLFKYFTENEINMFDKNKKNYIKKVASNLSVKEAFFKAISKEMKGLFKFRDVEVLRRLDGSPYINLYNSLHKFSSSFDVHVTISNEANIVTSFVVLSKNEYIKK